MSDLKVTDKRYKAAALPKTKNIEYKMVFKFNPDVEEQIKSKIWFEDFEINSDANNYIILTTLQPITNQLASWCISWWDTLEIIEPDELKQHIKKMMDSFKEVNKL